MPTEDGEGIQKRRGAAEADVEDPSNEPSWGPRASESLKGGCLMVFDDLILVQLGICHLWQPRS